MTSKEEENFLRIVYLHYRVVTPCLTRFFDGIHPHLSTSVNLPANKSVLWQLYKPPPRKKRILNDEQWNTLFPPAGFTPVTSAKLDLTLMVCLLRNISPVVKPPVKGFDERPPDSELNHGAHLARIKYYKNYLVSHSKDGTIIDNDFILIWSDLETAIKGLGNAQDVANANLAKSKVLDSSITTLLSTEIQIDTKLSNVQDQLEILRCNQEEMQTKYTCIYERMEVTEMKSQKMNDEGHGNYEQTNLRIESLEKNLTDLQNYRILLSQQSIRLEESLKTEFEATCSEIQRYISALETKADNIIQLLENGKTPIRCPEWMIIKRQQWKKADEYFVETKASGYVLDCIRRNNCVSIVGPSGVGKTFLLQHVALAMENNGFTIICVNSPSEIKENFKSGRKTLFVMDDMCGNFTANTVRLDEWKREMKDITSFLEVECKLILTCRLQVFQDEGFSHSCLKLLQTCVCNLIDKELALTDSEKEELVKMYFKNTQLRLDIKCLYQYDCFPLLCKWYDTNKDQSNFCLDTFLKAPFDYFTEELDDLFVDSKEGKYKFIALLLLVVCNNHLEQNIPKEKVNDIKKVINDITEQCGINDFLTVKSLILELDTMTGTFVSNEEGVYRTIHDKLFDLLAHYFGTQNAVTRTAFTELLITRADTNFIGERFELANSDYLYNDEFQYVITIQEDHLPMYIERVFDDMIKSDDIEKYLKTNRNVFNETFQKKLSTFMKQLDKDKQKMLIQHASIGFLCDMFVMNENDINTTHKTALDCYGVVLDPDYVQEYIQKIFDGMTKSYYVTDYIMRCRCCLHESFHTALQTYMTKLKPTTILNLIQHASTSFVQRMFVITKEYIIPDSPSIFKRYGIEIPCNLLHVYIARVFDGITTCLFVDMDIRQNRNKQNALFHDKLRAYMTQLDGSKIKEIIEIASQDCIDSLCVVNDDIEGNSLLKNEHYDNIFPLVYNKVYSYQKPRQKTNPHCSERQNKTTYRRIMTVMKTLWEIEHYGVIIPDEYIMLYIRRWFDGMKKSNDIPYYFNRNRNKGTTIFQTALLNLMVQLEEDEIKTLIQTATNDFLHKCFVTTQEDIKHDSDKMYQNYGIVIPKPYLEMYTDRILSLIKNPEHFILDMNCNRNIRTVLIYMSHLEVSKIAELLDTANDELFHRMITVDVEGKLPFGREIADWPYHDFHLWNELTITEGYIACPVSLINPYMDRMISDWGRGKLKYMIKNINLNNKTFVEKYVGHLNLLQPSKMLELLYVTNLEWKNSCERKYTALTVSCVNGKVGLAKWCLETHLYSNLYQQHDALCALFLLVVFNNHLELNLLNDNTTKIKAVICLFRELHNILEDVYTVSIKEILDTCFNGMLVINDGVFAVKHSVVFEFLVFYFTSIKEMTHILIETAEVQLLYEHFLVENSNKKQFLINLDAKQLHRCTERVFWEMTKSEKCLKYVLNGENNFNVKLIIDYMRYVNKEEIKTTMNVLCNDFIYKILCISDYETEHIKDVEIEPYIVLPDTSIPVYIHSFFKRVSHSDCVASCFQENRNRKKKIFHHRLSIYMKNISREVVKTLIKHASSDFICRLLVISEESIMSQSFWEYENYGIVIPEDCLQMYIDRVFGDLTKFEYLHVNRNSRNRSFCELLHSHTCSISETRLALLMQTASSKFISRVNLSTGEHTTDTSSKRGEYFLLFIPQKYYQIFKQQWPEGKIFKEESKSVYTSNVIEDDFGTLTLISRTVGDYELLWIMVKRYNELIIDNLQCHAAKYIDPILISNLIEFNVAIPESGVKIYIQRMIADWMKGKLHDVFGNINFHSKSFLSQFITYIRNTGHATQAKLAETNDYITGDSPLTVSCFFGISHLAEWCLDNYDHIDHQNKYKREFPLYIACEQNFPDVVLVLLRHENTQNVNELSKVYDYKENYRFSLGSHNEIILQLREEERTWKFSYGLFIFETPLYVACKYGYIDIVSLLLAYKADDIDINKGRICYLDLYRPKEYVTPLYIACKRGHSNIVSLLLNSVGVDVNMQTRELETPLFAACENGYKDIVSLLLECKETELNRCKNDGTTPLFATCREGHTEVVSTLLDHRDIDINKCIHNGMSPLFIASLLGHTQIVEMLLSKNADQDKRVKDKHDVKKLFTKPCTRYNVYSDKEILFIETYKKYFSKLVTKTCKNSPEYVKSYIDKLDVELLMDLIAGSSPLHIGSVMGHTEIVNLLAKYSLGINCVNEQDRTPLFLACELGHNDVVSVLLAKEACPKMKDKDGISPVAIAVQNGHMQITKNIMDRHYVKY